jgi:hypothetical protein
MTVGQQANNAIMDQSLTSLALQLRDVMKNLKNLNTQVNSQGSGTTYLQGIGYTSGDATTAATLIGYLSNLAGVYYGTATVASDFNFDNALSVLWGGNVAS